ncbi:hypothetical protein VTP01DRAFT_7980 [Rhizomucor pusillus]|uniref:uncharacterized protein n=1 Tax=Rhizomucor pusillus TaxID=4840 RepID=UPI003743D238
MSYSFSRDRTAELRDDRYNTRDRGGDGFGPQRTPTGYRSQRSYTRAPPSQQTNPAFAGGAGYNDAYDEEESYEMESLPQQQRRSSAELQTMEGFFREVDGLKAELETVSDNIERIERMHTQALVCFNEEQSRQISRDLSRLKSETQKRNYDIRNRLKAMQASNAKVKEQGDLNVRQSQTEALRRRFLETLQRYQDMERLYEKKYRQRVERQIRIVKPDATQEEMDRFIDSDDTSQVFAQSLMQASRTGQGRAVLSEVQTRHHDIKHIEKTIVELHQLFMDMQMLVEQQGETVKQVEDHMQTAVGHLEQGNTMIAKAIRSARATRHKKWCCLVLVIIICVVIAILVWWFGFNHPGVGDGNNR